MSRNRKKAYIDELESKVAKLEAIVGSLTAENEALKLDVSARRQAAGAGAAPELIVPPTATAVCETVAQPMPPAAAVEAPPAWATAAAAASAAAAAVTAAASVCQGSGSDSGGEGQQSSASASGSVEAL